MTSIHQTTNLVSPNFFHEFFSVWAVEKYNTFFFDPEQIFFSVLDQWKAFFLLQLLNWENFVEKIGENKICGLVVQCHKLIIYDFLFCVVSNKIYQLFFQTYFGMKYSSKRVAHNRWEKENSVFLPWFLSLLLII